MEHSHSQRVSYDMPQKQLDYFSSRARTFPAFEQSAQANHLYDKPTFGRIHKIHHRFQQQPESQEIEHTAVAQQGRFSERYQLHLGEHIPVDSKSHSLIAESTASQSYQTEESQFHKAPAPKAASQKPPSEVSSHAPSTRHRYFSVEPKKSSHPRTHREAVVNTIDFNSSYNALPSWHSSISQEQSTNNMNPAHGDMTQQTEDQPWTSKRGYKQTRGDHQAPIAELFASRSTLVSYDPRSEMSASFRSQHHEALAKPPAQERPAAALSYVPQQMGRIHPMRKALDRQEPDYSARHPAARGQADEYERMRDEEENCTFQPSIVNPSRPRKGNVQGPMHCESESTNLPHASRGDYVQDLYNKMHGDADTAKRRKDSRRAQKEIDDAEIEQNTRRGPRSTFANPRRTAVDCDTDPEEVFVRLYEDAQRYNKEKSEQERLIELKRQQELHDAPHELKKGNKHKEGTLDNDNEGAVSGNEKPAEGKPTSSIARKSASEIRQFFERLSQPNSIAIKFEKLKEQAEQEKREKEEKEAESKKNEMEKIARYKWMIPAKSFTFSDLQSHNAIYAS
ncbi:hypothetical protein LPMP_260750 [Leishmania panamensis]|uniref:Uncharacterized protein n=1 Tax=Leishmania panamensis TaxID=5679 RepID=A0A088RVC7_LEIPA|nr:hypothetical protein LPMP_260750 [Leishmania panamensis]AIN99189.1 hypothetical protein LPMP_260750 [Leishmania panamensis]